MCAPATGSDAPKCMRNLRFRWWCRRVCEYVSWICYHGNRHSASRCNGMAGAVLLARSSFHSDSASQLPMQEFVCVCVYVSLHESGVNPVWISVFISVPCYMSLALFCLIIFLILSIVLCVCVCVCAFMRACVCVNLPSFSSSIRFLLLPYFHLLPSSLSLSLPLSRFLFSISFSFLLPPPHTHTPSTPFPFLWVLKLIRVNRCRGCYLCFHLVCFSYKLSTGPAQCRRSA